MATWIQNLQSSTKFLHNPRDLAHNCLFCTVPTHGTQTYRICIHSIVETDMLLCGNGVRHTYSISSTGSTRIIKNEQVEQKVSAPLLTQNMTYNDQVNIS